VSRPAAGPFEAASPATAPRPAREAWAGFLLLLPITLGVCLLFLYPFGTAVWLSLTDKDLIRPGYRFVGLANYAELFRDPEFWASLWNNVVYAAATTALSTGLGLGVALLLNQPMRGRGLLASIIIFPYVVPTVVAALDFKWLFSDFFGLVNHLGVATGLLAKPRAWLGSPDTAMASVVVVSSWRFIPFAVICLLARLQGIPRDLYEAARMDGASSWRQFRDITLPMLKNVLLLVVLLRAIWMFNMFDFVWLLTGGGPAGVTQHLPVLAYLKVFREYQLGVGSALSLVMFGFLVLCLALYVRMAPLGEEGHA
jgi:multiple sugar transport system permease protein